MCRWSYQKWNVYTFSAASVIFPVSLSSRSFTSLASASALLLRGRAPTHFSPFLQGGVPFGGHNSPPSHWRGVQGSVRTLPHTWKVTDWCGFQGQIRELWPDLTKIAIRLTFGTHTSNLNNRTGRFPWKWLSLSRLPSWLIPLEQKGIRNILDHIHALKGIHPFWVYAPMAFPLAPPSGDKLTFEQLAFSKEKEN